MYRDPDALRTLVLSVRRHPDRRGIVVGSLLIALLLGLLMLPSGLLGSAGARASIAPNDDDSPGPVNLTVSGLSASAISLDWNATSDVHFSWYNVDYSNSSSDGPWSVLGSLSERNSTSYYVGNLTIGVDSWWRILEHSDPGHGRSSNIVAVTAPGAPQLAAALGADLSVHLSWSDPAVYLGHLSFGSYRLLNSVNGDPWVNASGAVGSSPRSFTTPGLPADAAIAFRLTALSYCLGAADSDVYPDAGQVVSNVVNLTTPAALTAVPSGDSGPVYLGSNVSLRCAVHGGESPYQWRWALGDGGEGSGENISHAYASPGNFSATCTATDRLGSVGSGRTNVSVLPMPTVGNTTGNLTGNSSGQLSSNSSGNGTKSGDPGLGNGTGTGDRTPPPARGVTPPGPSGTSASPSRWWVFAIAAAIVVALVGTGVWMAFFAAGRRPPEPEPPVESAYRLYLPIPSGPPTSIDGRAGSGGAVGTLPASEAAPDGVERPGA